MTRHHEKHDDKKHVKSHLEIALEKAETMAAGAAPHAGREGGKEGARSEASEIAALREKAAKADEYYDRLLRTAADLENYRKRAERERADLLKYGREELMAELIMVLDNFERALAAAPASGGGGVLDGVRLIQKQLLTVLEKNGLKPIEALGKPFNPDLHEAIAQIATGEHPEGTVTAEHLRGYTLNGRLLRPSGVTVSTRTEAGPPPAGPEGAE